MPIVQHNDRRSFLLKSFSAGAAAWLVATWPAEVAAAEAAQAMGAFTWFSPDQARQIDAMANQIYPATDTPGARQAHVVAFIDLALVTFAADKQPVYRAGFGELTKASGGRSFADLASGDQIKVLTAIETTPFFKTVRDHTVMGLFSAPQHGGNFAKMGWDQIGFDDSLNFQPPFGAYDKA